MPDLAIIVPTRGRPENIRKVISAWDFTNAWDHADLFLVADQDDPEIDGYRMVVADRNYGVLINELPTYSPHKPPRGLSLIEVPKWMPMVHKLDSESYRVAHAGYFALGFAGDDHLPQTIGWAERYLTVLRELGSGMVYGDDGYQGSKLSTEWAVTSDVVRALGRMVPAPVEHMYCDNSMMDLFGGAGAMRHLPEVRIEHMHPVAGKAQTDAQYQRVNHRDQFAKDRRAYEGWRGSVLHADQLDKIRRLRQGRPEVRPPKTRPERPGRSLPRGRITMRPPRFFKRVRGATPEDIMITLADFAAQVPADQEIVELGVFQGRTSLQLAWGARQGHGAHVTGVDPWALEGNVYDPPFTDDSSRRWAMHWVQSLGYSRDITLINGFSHDAAKSWGETNPKPVGLLFVDGDHTKEGARRDIEAWAPHLAEGARIAVDDYGHPDWPGVAEAVDELVAEGVLAEPQIFHDRLAVTFLATPPKKPGRTTAITSEGVSPSPYPAVAGQVAIDPTGPQAEEVWVEPDRATLEAEWEIGDPEGVAALRESAAAIDSDTSSREVVRHGELDDADIGKPVRELNTEQLRRLARMRGIVLGARKDKKAEMIQALTDGR